MSSTNPLKFGLLENQKQAASPAPTLIKLAVVQPPTVVVIQPTVVIHFPIGRPTPPQEPVAPFPQVYEPNDYDDND